MSAQDTRGPYGTVYRRWWHRGDVKALSFEARCVYVYAKTAPAGGLVGIFPLRPQDVRDDVGMGPRLAERALRELEASGFIQRERAWIWIVDALACTPGIRLENSKHRAAALKALAHVPDSLANSCRKLYGLYTELAVESGTNPDLYPIHGDGDGDGDGDLRTQEEERAGLALVKAAR